MEVRIYDRDLDLCGIVENQTSLLWNRKYNEVGSFELQLPITENNIELLKIGRLVTTRDMVETGIIEDLRFESNSSRSIMILTGRFLSSYLDRRVVHGTLNYNGTVEGAIRKLITDMVAIPHFQLGAQKGYTDTIRFQATYKGILDYVQKLCASANYGFRTIPDFTAKTMTFELYQGRDHSRGQTDRVRVEFSDAYGNIDSSNYRENTQLEKNVAYVGGQGEGSARVFTETGETSSTGFDRKEMYVDARDLGTEDLTTSEYIAVLKTRGDEKLKQQVFSQSFEVVTNPNGNFKYKQHYDVGDIITVYKPDWGISQNLRITGVTEIYEHEIMNVSLTFGTPLPSKIDWEDK